MLSWAEHENSFITLIPDGRETPFCWPIEQGNWYIFALVSARIDFYYF